MSPKVSSELIINVMRHEVGIVPDSCLLLWRDPFPIVAINEAALAGQCNVRRCREY